MTKQRVSRALVTALSVIAVLAAVWVLPPALHRARHLCPVRPDGVPQASAMPQWARRYGFDCSVCHTTVPQLTPVGYKFRRAGFRMPDEIGKEAKFKDIGDMYSVRVREMYHDMWGGTGAQSPQDKNSFLFNELTFYPISGAFGKYWGTETELTFMPDETPEVENGYARFTYPVTDDFFITARAGIMHPFEGYGGSDRSISNFRPLFETTSSQLPKNSAGNSAGTFNSRLRLWGDDQQGLELGATWKDTTLSVGIFNGLNASLHGGGNIPPADSAKRNTPGSPIVNDDDNDRDYLVFFNQMISDKGSFNAEYYHGNSNWNFANTFPAVGTDGTTGGETGLPTAADPTWKDKFDRGAFYAHYDALKDDKLRLMAGWEIGQDRFVNGKKEADGTNNFDKFNSTGWFAEVNSKLHEHFTGAVRYDMFKPSTRTGSNLITAETLTAAIPFGNVKFLLDYQIKRTQKANPTPDLTTNTIQFEWMAHF